MAKIKTITAFTNPKNDDIKKYKSLSKEFDQFGNILHENKFNNKGEIENQQINEFNEKGLIIKSKFIDNDQGISEIHEYFYDTNNELIKETINFGQGFLSIFIYEKDNTKKSLKIIEQDENGEIEESKLQIFDTNNNLLEETIFNDENKEINKIINLFDHKQRIIKKEETDFRYKTTQIHEYYYTDSGLLEGIKTINQKGRLLNWVKIEYDEQNRPIKQTSMNGILITIEYKNNNNRIERHYDAGGRIIEEIEIELNNEGNVIVEHSPEAIINYEYEYFDN